MRFAVTEETHTKVYHDSSFSTRILTKYLRKASQISSSSGGLLGSLFKYSTRRNMINTGRLIRHATASGHERRPCKGKTRQHDIGTEIMGAGSGQENFCRGGSGPPARVSSDFMQAAPNYMFTLTSS